VKDVSANFSQIRGVPSTVEPSRSQSNRAGDIDGSLFRDQLQALQGTLTTAPAPGITQAPKSAQVSALRFSNHAIDRMQARGIRFSPDDLAKFESAMGKAEAKGAKNTLLLSDAAAMIVNIKDKTVVTVMDKANLKENVFTNIDSTVMV
jgi:flagellar operon protein